MQVQTIKRILMRRDGITEEEADEIIAEAQEAFMADLEHGNDPEETFMDITGLEPDYLM